MNYPGLFLRLLGAALMTTATIASAQGWPKGPVRVVVPFDAGSTPDQVARVVSDKLAARLGQPMVVENKSGAAGNIGTDAVAKAAPDGQTIGVSIAGPLATKIRALAVASAKRSPSLPDLPTLAESGLPDVQADAWIGFIAPAKTPAAIAKKLHEQITQILAEPAVKDKLRSQYMDVVGNTPAEFRALLAADMARWKPVVQKHNIQLD